MNYFLVDYENVNVAGLNGLSNLTENDFIIIFYSENAETLTFGMHRRINESKAKISFQKVSVKEKNALDFQLCSYLGFLIRDTFSEENLNNYFVVSNDKSYLSLIDYWKRFKVDLKIVSNLSKNKILQNEIKLPPKIEIVQTQIKSVTKVEPTSELEQALKKFLTDKNEIAEAIKIVNNSKTKVEVNNNLGRKFTSRQGKIYQAVKSFIKDKKSQ